MDEHGWVVARKPPQGPPGLAIRSGRNSVADHRNHEWSLHDAREYARVALDAARLRGWIHTARACVAETRRGKTQGTADARLSRQIKI